MGQGGKISNRIVEGKAGEKRIKNTSEFDVPCSIFDILIQLIER